MSADAAELERAQASPRTLPAPFEDVQFKWDASDHYIELEYLGLPERLLECGAIEPHMVEKIRRGEPRPRRDSAGHYFQREVRMVRRCFPVLPLCVVRRITDARFAALLPGAPRLRFPRLDWLDAHPGEVHVMEEPTYREDLVQTLTAGTAQSLVAAGFQISPLRKNLRPQSYIGTFLCNLRDDAGGYIRPLMRGYYEVRITSSAPSGAPTSPPRRRAPKAAGLHLVVDNTTNGEH